MTCGCAAQGTVTGTDTPACVIHSCTTVAVQPDLTGRQARCTCKKVVASDASDSGWSHLPFFEYRGEGSPASITQCKHCRYAEVAHQSRPCERCDATGIYRGTPGFDHQCTRCNGTGTLGPAARTRDGLCPGFEPHGPWEFDAYYCGHSGWD